MSNLFDSIKERSKARKSAKTLREFIEQLCYLGNAITLVRKVQNGEINLGGTPEEIKYHPEEVTLKAIKDYINNKYTKIMHAGKDNKKFEEIKKMEDMFEEVKKSRKAELVEETEKSIELEELEKSFFVQQEQNYTDMRKFLELKQYTNGFPEYRAEKMLKNLREKYATRLKERINKTINNDARRKIYEEYAEYGDERY